MMQTFHSRFFGLLCACVAMAGCAAQALDEDDEASFAPVASRQQKVVGGELDDQFPAVGVIALYNQASGAYYGYGCSATLIDSEWVLTASHCLSGMSDSIDYMHFLLGKDANVDASYRVPQGAKVYLVDRRIAHDDYPDLNNVVDIALLHLATPVTDVAPIPIYTGNPDDLLDKQLKVVGYGRHMAMTPEEYAGTGVNPDYVEDARRRQGDVIVTDVQDSMLRVFNEETRTCYGDSGGALLVQNEGVWQIAGVNVGLDGTDTAYRCADGGAWETSVEAFKTWLSSYMDLGLDCRTDASLCHCAEACGSDGVCIPNACDAEAVHCRDGIYCMNYTNDWNSDCLYRLSVESNHLYADLMICLYPGTYVPETGHETGDCTAEYVACMADDSFVPDGSSDCYSVSACFSNCGTNANCTNDCLRQSTPDALSLSESLFYCMVYSGLDHLTGDAWLQAAKSACADYLSDCAPKTNCSLLGGGCDDGFACSHLAWGYNSCRKSAELEAGEACEAGSAACSDGFFCAPADSTASTYACAKACGQKSHCSEGEDCDLSLKETLGTGFCHVPFCTDEDGDGFCAESDDCDDHDAHINPAAVDLCGDGVDQDCSGADLDCNEGSGGAGSGGAGEGGAGGAGEGGAGEGEGGAGSDAGVEEADDDASSDDDGCSALPGSGSHGVLGLLLGLPLCLRRRRNR